MIHLAHITKIYCTNSLLYALRDINLHVAPGEFTAITGPSGSGKSTLMNILGCLDIPTEGSYRLDGQNVAKCTPNQLAQLRSRCIGFIFQGFNLLGQYSAIENVAMPLLYQGVTPTQRLKRAEEALRSVGLGARLHHKPAQLSGGQQQRVAIARALVTRPRLILADEPTGNLDSAAGQEVMALLRDVHAAGNTLLLITHDATIAAQAQRVITVCDGRITDDRTKI